MDMETEEKLEFVQYTNCRDCGIEMARDEANTLILKREDGAEGDKLMLCRAHYMKRIENANKD